MPQSHKSMARRERKRLREPVAGVRGIYSHWDFNDYSTLTTNGNYISAIRDKSGNGKHLTQPTAGNQPYRYDAYFGNGSGVAQFSGNQWLGASRAADWQFLHTGSDASLVACIINPYGTWQNNFSILGTDNSAAYPGVHFYWLGGDTTAGAMTGSPLGVANVNECFPSPFFDVPQVVWFESRPFESDPSLRLNSGFRTYTSSWDSGDTYGDYNYTYSDQDPSGVAAYPLALARPGLRSIAGWWFTMFNGDIGEVLIYRRPKPFTTAERTLIATYLENKWGLNVPL